MTTRLLALVTVLTAAAASAQTYIRPSKGKGLTIASDVSLNNPGITPALLSPVYDWSAFSGMQVRMYVTKNGAPITDLLTDCACIPQFVVKGAAEPNSSVFFQEFDFNASVNFVQNNTASITYTVGNVSPYVKFETQVDPTSCSTLPIPPFGPDPAKQGCKLNVTVVPFPTDSTMRVNFGSVLSGFSIPMTGVQPVQGGGILREYNGTTGAATINMQTHGYRFDRNEAVVSTNGASYGNNTIAAPVAVTNIVPAAVFNAGDLDPLPCNAIFPAAGYPINDFCLKPNSVTVQNVGAFPVRCAFTSANVLPSPPVVSAVNYQFILKAATAPGNGGTRTFKNVMKPYSVIQCIAVGGTSSVAALPF